MKTFADGVMVASMVTLVAVVLAVLLWSLHDAAVLGARCEGSGGVVVQYEREDYCVPAPIWGALMQAAQ